MQSKIITLEGVDKTGKDSVRDLIVKKSSGNVLVNVRSYISQIVYSRLYNREIDESFFFEEMLCDSSRGRLFFVLTADVDVIAKRIVETGETDIDVNQIREHADCFREVADELMKKAIRIMFVDTSFDSIEQTAEKILRLL